MKDSTTFLFIFLIFGSLIALSVALAFMSQWVFADYPGFVVNAYVMRDGDYYPIPVHLVEAFPEEWGHMDGFCKNDTKTKGCFNPRGGGVILIIKGYEGARPSEDFGGCSLLWHELKHAEGLNHFQMAKQFPNKECSSRLI